MFVAVTRALTGLPLSTSQGWLFESEVLPSQFDYFLSGRFMVATIGVLTILVVWRVGTRLGGPLAGVLAAWIIAVAPLHVWLSRSLTTDVPVGFMCALVALLTIRALKAHRARWWIAAVGLAGLAASTKWNGSVVLIIPLLAYALSAQTRAFGLLRATPYLMVVAALAALLVTTPAILLDTATVKGFLVAQVGVYGAPVNGAGQTLGVAFNLTTVATGFGVAGGAAIAAGLASVVRRTIQVPRMRLAELAILAFIATYFLIASVPQRQYERNLLPIIPLLAVIGGIGTARAVTLLFNKARQWNPDGIRRLGSFLLSTALVLAVLTPATLASIEQGNRLMLPDTRTLVREWLLASLPATAVIARESYTPQLSPDEFELRTTPHLYDQPWAWYREEGVEYLVTSSFNYDRFYGNIATPTESAFYSRLFGLAEVFSVAPSDDLQGPTIRVFWLR